VLTIFKKEKLLDQNVETLEEDVKLSHQDSVKIDNIKMDANIKNAVKFQKEMEKLFTEDVKTLKEVAH